jgi:protein-S-isoprenylcysteine O-methyltransferase Ste14
MGVGMAKQFFRQLSSFVLPVVVVVIVPGLGIARFHPFSLAHHFWVKWVQLAAGSLLQAFGLFLLVRTIGLFISVGRGTLAPWDPTQQLVVRGVYRYVRNPMILGVAVMILGESVALGSWWAFGWFVIVIAVNTIYFKVSEEPGLVRRFGNAYVEYRRHVPMWIPRLRAWR